MYWPSRDAGEGPLRNWVTWACGAPCVLHWHAPPVLHWRLPPQHVCLCVMERCCCASIFFNPMALPRPPFSPAAALQSLRPSLLILNYPGSVPTGQGRATSQGTVYDPLRPPVGQNTVNVMDWMTRQKHTQSPKGDKIWPSLPWWLRMGRMVIGGQPEDHTWCSTFTWWLNGWMHLVYLAQVREWYNDSVFNCGTRRVSSWQGEMMTMIHWWAFLYTALNCKKCLY